MSHKTYGISIALMENSYLVCLIGKKDITKHYGYLVQVIVRNRLFYLNKFFSIIEFKVRNNFLT